MSTKSVETIAVILREEKALDDTPSHMIQDYIRDSMGLLESLTYTGLREVTFLVLTRTGGVRSLLTRMRLWLWTLLTPPWSFETPMRTTTAAVSCSSSTSGDDEDGNVLLGSYSYSHSADIYITCIQGYPDALSRA
ncbi:hypothetical protein WOLCODRAFT_20608 [Wolfiporia cocos MD-104 SS10]|uniref:Uncharacterized protein n=1 Tax=Wolfiporia cocos (strain MD-104) TaxID=742152 RepID=A0A2H3JKL9_WOLCO|nr:hypothetical protein WOLCODRAFT_20608 [Wolfiporia cocos MD-104 SS10]